MFHQYRRTEPTQTQQDQRRCSHTVHTRAHCYNTCVAAVHMRFTIHIALRPIAPLHKTKHWIIQSIQSARTVQSRLFLYHLFYSPIFKKKENTTLFWSIGFVVSYIFDFTITPIHTRFSKQVYTATEVDVFWMCVYVCASAFLYRCVFVFIWILIFSIKTAWISMCFYFHGIAYKYLFRVCCV